MAWEYSKLKQNNENLFAKATAGVVFCQKWLFIETKF